MYLPPQFNSTNKSDAIALMRAYAFASLISVDDAGLPFVTHLPLHLEEQGDQWVLLGHVAKANVHWRYLQARAQAVVTFIGPHAYLSPQVYPDLTRVPTWNYLTLHCTVQARLIEAPFEKEAVLQKLIADYEPAYAAQWQALEADYQQKMLSGIVAFELQVTAWQCKFKLNQHRPESHAKMHAAYARGTSDERALAEWLVRLGLASPTLDRLAQARQQ
jgi:transcriptional regulator